MLVRRYGQVRQPSTDNQPPTVYTKFLDSAEEWQLYFTQYHGFHAVENSGLWQLTPVDSKKSVISSLILGTIQIEKPDVPGKGPTNRNQRMSDLYSKIQTMTGSSQHEAINATINMLKSNELDKGLKYTPTPENPNAWTKIFLAMTDYDKYKREFPDDKDPYIRLPDGTPKAQRAAFIHRGSKQFSRHSSGSQSRKNPEAQGSHSSGGQSGKEGDEQADDGE
ncbi:hypothetical protein DFH05DRAFT_1464978 [Lentinula detonsa]|uniref:Uncharacterized protein n=1 Tax=Lentinula detonsa TaxID=2804962 RepID=A0A9W8P9T2_9AGAR|nr:hypothetical protein DFH05DRAFT_1464978 [Lentinula detonsa]